MKSAVSLGVCLMVLAFAGSASHAMAITAGQSKVVKGSPTDMSNLAPLSPDVYSTDPIPGFPKPQSKVYQFNLKGKWGVKLDVNQPATSPSGFNDIDAGAFYKLTPSLRVGGTLGFGEKTTALQPQPQPTQADKTHPRVRVETSFNF